MLKEKDKYVNETRILIKDAFDISTVKQSRDLAYAMAKLSYKLETSENIREIKYCYEKIKLLYSQVLMIEGFA